MLAAGFILVGLGLHLLVPLGPPGAVLLGWGVLGMVLGARR